MRGRGGGGDRAVSCHRRRKPAAACGVRGGARRPAEVQAAEAGPCGGAGYKYLGAGGGGRHRSAAAELVEPACGSEDIVVGCGGFVKSDVEINYSLIEGVPSAPRPGARVCDLGAEAHSLVEPR